jgi:hypothetical protein
MATGTTEGYGKILLKIAKYSRYIARNRIMRLQERLAGAISNDTSLARLTTGFPLARE